MWHGSQSVRLRIIVRGAVQGVGFRPFVYRLAVGLDLAGWVSNSVQGAWIELEGAKEKLEQFLARLGSEMPPNCFLQSVETAWLDPAGYTGFEIRASDTAGEKTALVLPDIATCADCVREIFDPADRRYRYPFTNCTNCGPRYSIIEALPYDRANTSMRLFQMCPSCQAEYDNPRDRRFHAQPNACPVCGPHLELWDPMGKVLATHDDALRAASEAVRAGQVVAVKGLGGFHLIVDARNDSAVRRLRQRKGREEKPFALMFPSLAVVRAACALSPAEERLLRAPEAPIVLVQRNVEPEVRIAESVAPGNPYLGVMLPYTPLHHLLMAELGFPVVATSGNRSDEPICTDELDALDRLRGIADLFLVHNRPIVRHVDDSIVQVVLGRELVLRRARGYAPLPIMLNATVHVPKPEAILAVGAQLKNAIALRIGRQVFVSQHIGDLDTELAQAAFRRVTADLQRLYERRAGVIVADLHPDYVSTRVAEQLAGGGSPAEASVGYSGSSAPQIVHVQHHIAHVLACMAENELEPPVLGVSWDGTGYGLDGTVWGGEFFVITAGSVRHVARLRRFRLPGGDKAIREPRRTALGLLFELAGHDESRWMRLEQRMAGAFKPAELQMLTSMLDRRLNSPVCSSVGRLFDAVAALLGLCYFNRFEGQAAMALEFAAVGAESPAEYHLRIRPVRAFGPGAHAQSSAQFELDWAPMVETILHDIDGGLSVGQVAAGFHNALAEAIVAVAHRAGQERVVLSGGCFQNRLLTERAVRLLERDGFRPYWHQRVPPNDGGVALGQVIAATCGVVVEQPAKCGMGVSGR